MSLASGFLGLKVKWNVFFFYFQGEELAAFEVVVLQMLEDVQERLVYRAQVTTNSVWKLITYSTTGIQYRVHKDIDRDRVSYLFHSVCLTFC